MSSLGARIAFDTNVLVYAINDESEFFDAANLWLKKVEKREVRAVITPQNLAEFCAVVTSKRAYGKKFITPRQASWEIEKILTSRIFEVVYSYDGTMENFLTLIKLIGPKAQKVHDVFLAATLLSNGVDTLLTADSQDFAKMPELKTIELV